MGHASPLDPTRQLFFFILSSSSRRRRRRTSAAASGAAPCAGQRARCPHSARTGGPRPTRLQQLVPKPESADEPVPKLESADEALKESAPSPSRLPRLCWGGLARRATAAGGGRRTSAMHALLLFGCIGLGNRSYDVVHGLARGLTAAITLRSARRRRPCAAAAPGRRAAGTPRRPTPHPVRGSGAPRLSGPGSSGCH